ncbi:MAG: toxin-antitoxin system protein [Clostridia bacterium]|nr:toxin-antitoxin system protein [Clostridia bacterium]
MIVKKNVSLTLDHDVVEGIKALAEESDRSFSQYVNMVLKRILKNKAERDQNEKEEE